MQKHHCIPISLYGENIGENIVKLDRDSHTELHQLQNVPYNIIRRYKEKTNSILVPDDYCIDGRIDIWKEYFEGAKTFIIPQKQSLAKQIARYNGIIGSNEIATSSDSFDNLVSQLGEKQKYLIKKILKNEIQNKERF